MEREDAVYMYLQFALGKPRENPFPEIRINNDVFFQTKTDVISR